MATRGKRSRKTVPARKARRPARGKHSARRTAAARARIRQLETGGRARAKSERRAGGRQAERAASASAKRAQRAPGERRSSGQRADSAAHARILAASSNWKTLRVVWRPALAVATLPYRVYRWAEAASHRSGAVAATA